MELVIRKATRKDFEATVKLTRKLRDYHRKFDPTYKTGKVFSAFARKYLNKDLASRNSLLLVVESAGNIVGFCLGRIQKPSWVFSMPLIGFVFDVFVEPRFRRKRIAKELLRLEFDWFRKRKIRHVELFVDTRNPLGMSAWHKYGFRPLLIRMRKDLSK